MLENIVFSSSLKIVLPCKVFGLKIRPLTVIAHWKVFFGIAQIFQLHFSISLLSLSPELRQEAAKSSHRES